MMPSVRRASVVTHGVTRNVDEAVTRLVAVAGRAGVELLFEPEEAAKHGVSPTTGAPADIAVVLGGDGTMLRALARFLDSGVPVFGANFGRVGFLTAIAGAELEEGLARVFTGDTRAVAADARGRGRGRAPRSGQRRGRRQRRSGRIIALSYAIGGEDLGTQPCDGVICATPSGSTAYNLSNGGPVLVWGLDAAVITFVAPHTLHARPLVVGPDLDLVIENRTPDVEAVVLVDGRRLAALGRGEQVKVRFGKSRTHLATLPEQTFFGRYGQVFGAG